MPSHYVVAVICSSCVGKLRNCSLWRFTAFYLYLRPLRDYSSLSDLSGRIRARAYLLIYILEFKVAESSTPGARAHSILSKTLNHAVRNTQGVAALPIHPVPGTLH